MLSSKVKIALKNSNNVESQGEENQKSQRDPFSKAVMHIISKEYHKETEINETLRSLIQSCLLEWENLQQVKQIAEEEVEAHRIINNMARSFSMEINKIRSYRRGTAIFFYGDKDEYIYFIIKGTVQFFIPKTQAEMRSDAEFNLRMQFQSLPKNKKSSHQLEQQSNALSQESKTKEENQLASQTLIFDSQPSFGLVINAIQKFKGSHVELLKGNEKVKKKYLEGSQQIAKIKKVGQAGPKQSFGELSLVTEKPRACTAIVSEEAFVVSFSAKSYRNIVGDNFSFLNSKDLFLNNYFAQSVRKETIFHLGVLFDKELILNLGELLYRQGEVCSHVYLLKRGKIEFQRHMSFPSTKNQSKMKQKLQERQDFEDNLTIKQKKEDSQKESKVKEGMKEICLGMISSGELFGFEDLLVGNTKGYSHFSKAVEDNRRSYCARVVSANAIVYSIERAAFLRILQSNSVMDQDIKNKAVLKTHYHHQRIEELKKFEESKTAFQYYSKMQQSQESFLKKSNHAPDISNLKETNITNLEVPLFNVQNEIKNLKKQNTIQQKRKLSKLTSDESLFQQIQDSKALFQQKQQQSKQQKVQVLNQQSENKAKQSSGLFNDEYLAKIEQKYKEEMAAFEIPKDIAKGNVQFIKLANSQFSDFKSMKEYYQNEEEKFRKIKKSKHELNMTDENLITFERIYSLTNNSSLIRQFKNSYTKKNIKSVSHNPSNASSPRRYNNYQGNNGIIFEKEETNESENSICKQRKVNQGQKERLNIPQSNFNQNLNEQNLNQQQNTEKEKQLSKISLNLIETPQSSHYLESMEGQSMNLGEKRLDAFTSQNSSSSPSYPNSLCLDRNKKIEYNNELLPASADKVISDHKIFQFLSSSSSNDSNFLRFSHAVTQNNKQDNSLSKQDFSQFKLGSFLKNEMNEIHNHHDNQFNIHRHSFVQIKEQQLDSHSKLSEFSSQILANNGAPSLKEFNQTKPKQYKRKFKLSLPDLKLAQFEKQQKQKLLQSNSLTNNFAFQDHPEQSQQEQIERINSPYQEFQLNQSQQFEVGTQFSPSNSPRSFLLAKNQAFQSDLQFPAPQAHNQKPIYFNQYLARSESAKKLLNQFKDLISSRENHSSEIKKKKHSSTHRSSASSVDTFQNSKFSINPANFNQSTYDSRQNKISSTSIKFFVPQQQNKIIQNSQQLRLIQKTSKQPQSYFQSLFFCPQVQ